ncbi:hypothetical protein IAU60_006823 [Kwoniella sp. DSM 27419]
MDITLDDASPLLSFVSPGEDGWVDDHNQGSDYYDPNVNSYSMSTFHATALDGDYMQLKFNGTGVVVYGAKRFNHGVYGVVVDGADVEYFSGYSGPAIFQQEMYRRDNLTAGVEHVITVTNHPNLRNIGLPNSEFDDSWLDIDHVTITAPAERAVYTTTIEDDDKAVQYGSGWGVAQDPDFHGGTSRVSKASGDVMKLVFSGSSIELFGGVNVDHGNYSVSIDGGLQTMWSGNNWERLYQVPKYLVTGLQDTQHTLQLTNLGNARYPVFGFDYALVRSSIRPAGGNTTTSVASSSNGAAATGSGGANKHIGEIAGGVVGGLVGLFLVALLAWCLFGSERQRRRVARREARGYAPSTPDSEFEPKFPRAQMGIAGQHDMLPWSQRLMLRLGYGQATRRVGDAVPPSPDGSVAFFYDAHHGSGSIAPMSPRDNMPNARPPPSDLPRSAASILSGQSALSPSSPLSPRATGVLRPPPRSMPSSASIDPSEYAFVHRASPLTRSLPRLDTYNLPSRPGTSHTARSSILLPSSPAPVPTISGRTFGQGSDQFSTPPRTARSHTHLLGHGRGSVTTPDDFSPRSPPTATTLSPDRQWATTTPSDWKESLLNLPYFSPSSSTATTGATSPMARDTGYDSPSQSPEGTQPSITASRQSAVASIMTSPPPDYLSATQLPPDAEQGERE